MRFPTPLHTCTAIDLTTRTSLHATCGCGRSCKIFHGILIDLNVSLCSLLGEGYHNFHHTFPFDYRSCERDDRMDFFNWGCVFIDWMAAWNQSYDLRIASPQLIAKRSLRTGDGSRAFDPDVNEPEIWEDKNGNLLNLDDEVKAQDSQFEVYRLKAL